MNFVNSNPGLKLVALPQGMGMGASGSSVPAPTSPGQGNPSPFPICGSIGRPSQSINPYGMYKYGIVPKQSLGVGANPAGGGNGNGEAEFNDQYHRWKNQNCF